MPGTVTETWTPQWSEKGQGTTEQAKTEEKGNANKVDAQGGGTIPLGPRETGRRRVQIPEDVYDTTCVEKTTKGRGTLTG